MGKAARNMLNKPKEVGAGGEVLEENKQQEQHPPQKKTRRNSET